MHRVRSLSFIPSLSRALRLAAFFTLPVASCFGALITYSTPAGSTTGGQPVNGTATFTTGNGTVHIEITNNLVNPTSVVQNISGLSFVLSSGQTVGVLSSSSGLERNVAGNRTYTDGGAPVATGWALLNNVSGGLKLNVLGTAVAPEHTIIGLPSASNLYTNANGSIAGNNAHNPFLGGTVSFDLAIPGVTVGSTITSATFFFGTTDGANSVTLREAPEPVTTSLVGVGLLALGIARRRGNRK